MKTGDRVAVRTAPGTTGTITSLHTYDDGTIAYVTLADGRKLGIDTTDLVPFVPGIDLLDAEQGVCPEGHVCYTVTTPRGTIERGCTVPHEGRDAYRGSPILREDLTRADVERAAAGGADPLLIDWARITLAEREAEHEHEHEVDHDACDRDAHLARRESGEDCPLVRCWVCGLIDWALG